MHSPSRLVHYQATKYSKQASISILYHFKHVIAVWANENAVSDDYESPSSDDRRIPFSCDLDNGENVHIYSDVIAF